MYWGKKTRDVVGSCGRVEPQANKNSQVVAIGRPGRVVTKVSCYEPHNVFKICGYPLEFTQAISICKSYMLEKSLVFNKLGLC